METITPATKITISKNNKTGIRTTANIKKEPKKPKVRVVMKNEERPNITTNGDINIAD